jgi:ABC-type transport system involved in multi-copper enzyme maturation permease subunit
MILRWGLGPVFVYESLRTSRRWQLYAGRSVFIGVLLIALFAVWLQEVQSNPLPTLKSQARVGEKFFYGLIGTQLVLVLLAAPLLTAGSVCLEKARGTLLYLLTTDLSNTEIVAGKLLARLLPVFGLLVVGLPVPALNLLLGGIDPGALFGAYLVTVGVALLTATLAFTFSVWCQKTHEVLMLTYLAVALLIVGPWLWDITVAGLGLSSVLAVGGWAEQFNPFSLAFAPYMAPGTTSPTDYFVFLGGCVVLSLLLVMVAACSVRRVAVRQANRPLRRRWSFRLWPGFLPRLSPDLNPILWWEWYCRRPSLWVRIVWAIYALLAIGFTVLSLVESHSRGRGPGPEFAPFVVAFVVSIGLLLVTISAVTSLSEDRSRGVLDMLLTTPLHSATIVLGKWWGTFRAVLLLAVLPVLTVVFLSLSHEPVLAIPNGLLMGGLVVAYGAAVTSLGLAAATWFARPVQALTLSVVPYLIAAAGPVLFLLMTMMHSESMDAVASGSPWYGPGLLTFHSTEMGARQREVTPVIGDLIWIGAYSYGAVLLLLLVIATFDRCVGRFSGGIRRMPPPRRRRPTAART